MTENATPKETSSVNLLTPELVALVLSSTHPSMTAATKLFVLHILNGYQGRRRGLHKLAGDLGLSVNTIQTVAKRLKACGALSISNLDASPEGAYLASRYTVNVDRIRELANPPKIERVWPYEAPVNGEVPDSHYPHLGV